MHGYLYLLVTRILATSGNTLLIGELIQCPRASEKGFKRAKKKGILRASIKCRGTKASTDFALQMPQDISKMNH